MNAIINMLLLPGDKFMPEMHLKQAWFTYSTCGPFTKNKEITKKITETGDSRYIYQNELDKACFQNDSTSGGTVKNKNISDKELAKKLQKPIIKKFEKRKVRSSFIDNIWGAYLEDMQLISIFNKGFRFFDKLLIFIANMHGLFL